MIAWLRKWWRARQHAVDLSILWPACKRQAPSLDEARLVFIRHMAMDPSYAGMTEDELGRFVRENLT